MKKIFVDPFENKERRERLLNRFESFLTLLKSIPVNMEIWLDGSFATKKECPGDIDLVVICDIAHVNKLSIEKQNILRDIFQNHAETKLRYECDAYFILNDMHDKSYWRGLFGFDRDENPKGIARLKIEAKS